MATAVAKKKSKKKSSPPATAFHDADGSNHVVGIGNLRVVLLDEGTHWFAQGLEIDYVAQGKTVEDVKHNFQEGLCETVHANLEAFGTIKNILVPAPQEVWKELLYSELGDVTRFTQVSVHYDISQLPFQEISYLHREAKAA